MGTVGVMLLGVDVVVGLAHDAVRGRPKFKIIHE
jgi:hypothetical protein